jgi:hypothetical protein
MEFQICKTALEAYRALKHDPHCNYSLCVIPLGSITWPDEHPGRGPGVPCMHPECEDSILRIFLARTRFWQDGAVPKTMHATWNEARALIPEWPLFKRLDLTPDQRTGLTAAREEQRDVMGLMRDASSEVEYDDRGGGLGEIRFKRDQGQ